ncbi:Alpha-endosulfine [Plecturocebus cupreus]
MRRRKGVLPERAEKAKLDAKYPSLGQKPGGSDFLMKRLQEGQKYFDSGDYDTVKANMKEKQLSSAEPDKNLVTGDHIPTPQDLPQRRSSLIPASLPVARLNDAAQGSARSRAAASLLASIHPSHLLTPAFAARGQEADQL